MMVGEYIDQNLTYRYGNNSDSCLFQKRKKKEKSEHKLAQPEFELVLPISFSDWVCSIEQKVDIYCF